MTCVHRRRNREEVGADRVFRHVFVEVVPAGLNAAHMHAQNWTEKKKNKKRERERKTGTILWGIELQQKLKEKKGNIF